MEEDKGSLSDGYHTFNQLYDHRHVLFAALLRVYAPWAFKTLRNDKGVQWNGWFIAGLNTPYGQVTYHMPIVWWPRLSWVKEIDCNRDYDGHTSQDVVDRLARLALLGFEGLA